MLAQKVSKKTKKRQRKLNKSLQALKVTCSTNSNHTLQSFLFVEAQKEVKGTC